MDLVYVCLTLVLPFVLSLFVVASFVGIGSWKGKRLKSIFSLDTSKGLASQGLLWLAIIFPIFTACVLGVWVWSEYNFELSIEGYKKFVEISILPLGVMSLALPLAGLVSRFHSTQQTAKQIEVVSFKNNLDAFYSHRKEMLNYFDSMNTVNYLGVIDLKGFIHPVLHRRFFLGSPETGFPLANVDSFKRVEKEIVSGARSLNILFRPGHAGISMLDCYLQACSDICVAAEMLHITEVTNDLVSQGVMIKSNRVDEYGYDLWTIGTTTLQALAAIRMVKNFFDNLCDFAVQPRMKMPEGLELVFNGGQSLLDADPVIEKLHKREINELVAIKRARYDEMHPKIASK